jgi:hypothetical protein
MMTPFPSLPKRFNGVRGKDLGETSLAFQSRLERVISQPLQRITQLLCILEYSKQFMNAKMEPMELMGLTAPAPNNGVALITLRLIMRPYPSFPKRWTLTVLKNHKYYIIMLKIKLGTNTILPLETLKLVKVTRQTMV